MKRRFSSALMVIILLCTLLAGSPAVASSADEFSSVPSSAGQKLKAKDLADDQGNDPAGANATSKYTMYNGQTLQLKINNSKKATWSSSDKTIATVSKTGLVKAKKVGTVTITAKVGSKKYKAKVTVKSPLSVEKKKVSLTVGEEKALRFTFMLSGFLTYKVDNPEIVRCTWDPDWNNNRIDLLLTGQKTGSAVVTVSNSETSDKIKIKVSVKAPEPEETEEPENPEIPENPDNPEDPEHPVYVAPVYRALLIGEVNFFNDYSPRNQGDVNLMANMLKRVYGPRGSKYQIKKKIDASYSQIRSLIQSTFSATTDNDVSLFFIATHGDSDGDGELAMPSNSSYAFLPFSTLASWLSTYVRGEVIVIIESCGAGSAIYAGREEQNSYAQEKAASEKDTSGRIVSAAIRAFSAADQGLSDPKAGELRLPKFYVLAASRHRELSWGTADNNFFTEWLTEGVSSDGDQNNDNYITLTELFNYIRRVGDGYAIPYEGQNYYQHVQRYPAGSQYELFRLQ